MERKNAKSTKNIKEILKWIFLSFLLRSADAAAALAEWKLLAGFHPDYHRMCARYWREKEAHDDDTQQEPKEKEENSWKKEYC